MCSLSVEVVKEVWGVGEWGGGGVCVWGGGGGIQSDPGNSICPVNISAITHPTDQMSTTWEGERERRREGGREEVRERGRGIEGGRW